MSSLFLVWRSHTLAQKVESLVTCPYNVRGPIYKPRALAIAMADEEVVGARDWPKPHVDK